MRNAYIPNNVSMREMQRNYKKVIEEAKRVRGPIFLTKGAKPQAVVLDLDVYEKLLAVKKKKPRISWREIETIMKDISRSGRKISLSDFIIKDRKSH